MAVIKYACSKQLKNEIIKHMWKYSGTMMRPDPDGNTEADHSASTCHSETDVDCVRRTSIDEPEEHRGAEKRDTERRLSVCCRVLWLGRSRPAASVVTISGWPWVGNQMRKCNWLMCGTQSA